MKKILIVDDDIQMCTLLSNYFSKHGYEVNYVLSANKALLFLKEQSVDLVFCDYRLPDITGRELMVKIKEKYKNLPIIIITGYADVKIAVDVMKNGAFDFITKPFIPEELVLTAQRALKINTEVKPIKILEEVIAEKETTLPKHTASLFVGSGEQARELNEQVKLVAPTNYSVIIYGESGTGKESVAFNIHSESKRKNKPFIAVDCGALSKELAGSELFGHEKGSFTGALQSKTGQFELANGGTIFLDEIGNLSYDIQVSLLRVIQERKIRKIGSEKEIPIDVRVIVASNEKLSAAVTSGKFREDLYHRFNEFTIDLLPLREQGIEIMTMAAFFLKAANKELSKNVQGFAQEVKEIFSIYNWPGNIREIKNLIKRAVLLAEGEYITADLLPIDMLQQARFDLAGYTFNQNVIVIDPVKLKDTALQAEYLHIVKTLKQVNFNKSKAARLLKIDRKTLYNKMEAFDILLHGTLISF